MKDNRFLLPKKIPAVLSVLTGFSPLFLILGVKLLPGNLLYFLLPLCTGFWGWLSCALPSKRRLLFSLLGLIPLGFYFAIYLFPQNWMTLFYFPVAAVPLFLLPPVCNALMWDEWSPSVWIGGGVAHMIGQILVSTMHLDTIKLPLLICLAAYFLLLLLKFNAASLRESTNGKQKVAPAMRRRNLFTTLVIYVLGLLFASRKILAAWLESFWTFIKLCIANFLIWLLSGKESEGAGGQGMGGDNGLADMLGADQGGPSRFWEIMQEIFYYLAIAVVVAAIILVLIFLFKKLRQLFKKLAEMWRKYAAISEGDYVDETESTLDLDDSRRAIKEKINEQLSRFKQPRWNELDGRQKLRRLYAQYLKKHPDEITSTAWEALGKDEKLDAKVTDRFATMYDRARYSTHDISQEDAEAIKGMLK